ncbi:hypothetical protein [Nostoc sp. CALU 546]
MKNSMPLAGWSFWVWQMGYGEESPMPNAQCPMPNAPIETLTTIPDNE